jgi:DNA-binding transcriptional LysR family regulator
LPLAPRGAKMHSMNVPRRDWLWDDVRFFLTICQEGSLSAAARTLGVDHSTVGRRLAAFEGLLGTKLIGRTPEGLLITPAGRQILADCETMEAAAIAVQRRAAGQDTRAAGLVTVATSESLAFQLIAPAIAELRSTHPELRVNVRVGFRLLDLSRRQADIAVRLSRPTEYPLIGKKLGSYGITLYASRNYLEKHGVPKRGQGLKGHSLIAYLVPVSLSGSPFMGEIFDDSQIVFKSNSTFAQLAAVADGLGLAELPCCVADLRQEVRRVWPNEPPALCSTWLVAHEDLRRATRIRLVAAAITRQFEQRRRILRYGLSAPPSIESLPTCSTQLRGL